MAIRPREAIELGLLANPKNPQSDEAHQINHELRTQGQQRSPQVTFTVDQFPRGHMQIQQEQCHGDSENAIAQGSQPFHAFTGYPVVNRASPRNVAFWLTHAPKYKSFWQKIKTLKCAI